MFNKPKDGESSPIIQPAATIMLLRETKENEIKVLLLKRNEALKFAPGYWVFPGGKIELDEVEQTSTIEAAARLGAIRETREETGLIVEDSALKLTTTEAFELLKEKKLPILPPTYVSMLRISTLNTRAEIDKEMASGIPNIVPITTFIDGVFYSFYEGDAALESKDHNSSGPRHRIIGDLKNGTYQFVYEGCDHIFPVTGRSVLQ